MGPERSLGEAHSVLYVAAREDLYGVSRAVLACAKHLAAFGFRPLLVTPKDGPLQSAARALGLAVRSWSPSGQRGWRLGTRALFEGSSVIDWARSERVELLAAGSLSAFPSAQHLADKLGVPAAVHLRNTYQASGRVPPFVKYQADRARLVLAVSAAVLASYHRAIGSPHQGIERVVPDGIESFTPMTRSQARVRLQVEEHELCLGTIGAISPEKGTLFAAEIAEATPGARLLIAGAGSEEQTRVLRERAAVRLLGFDPSIRESLPAFDLVLHPSRGEAFGLAPLEAMAAGVPVIASNVGGLPEALGDGAVLLPPNDRQAWVAAVRRILEDEAFRSDLIARGLAQAQRMSARAAAERTAAAYRELLG